MFRQPESSPKSARLTTGDLGCVRGAGCGARPDPFIVDGGAAVFAQRPQQSCFGFYGTFHKRLRQPRSLGRRFPLPVPVERPKLFQGDQACMTVNEYHVDRPWDRLRRRMVCWYGARARPMPGDEETVNSNRPDIRIIVRRTPDTPAAGQVYRIGYDHRTMRPTDCIGAVRQDWRPCRLGDLILSRKALSPKAKVFIS
jgi:hypothetical protein